jgi:hypothetical protein
MGICILGMGDCGNKTDVKSITNITNINKTMTNMVSTQSQTVSATQINTQNMKVEVLPPPGYNASWGPLLKNCTSINNQTMDASQKVSVTLDTKDTKALQNQVASALKAASDTAIKQKTDLFQTASNDSNNYTNVNQVIDNLVSTNITSSVTNELKQLMRNAQNNSFKTYGPVDCGGKSLSENTQKMITSQIAEVLTKALTGTTLENALKSSADSAIKNDIDQKGGGLTDFIKGVFEGLGSLFGSMYMIFIIIFIVIGALLYMFRAPIIAIFKRTPAGKLLTKSEVSNFGKSYKNLLKKLKKM